MPADFLITLDKSDSRPRQLRFHVGSSPSFEWDPSRVVAWLDIANARVEIHDQLRSDVTVVDAPLTLNPATERFEFTLDETKYPIRATRYKMNVRVEKTDGSFVEYPNDEPGFTQLLAYAEGEDPLNLEELHQNLLNANALLGALYNAQRNPPDILLVDKTYEGYETEGQTYSDPVAARDYAVQYIEDELIGSGVFRQVVIILHGNGAGDSWSEDPAQWYPSYVEGPYDQLVKYYSSYRRATNPTPQVFIGRYEQSGTGNPTLQAQITPSGIKAVTTKTAANTVFLTRTGVGRYRVGIAGMTFIPDLPQFAQNIDNNQLHITLDVEPFNSGSELTARVTIPRSGATSQPPEIEVLDDTGNETDDWSGVLKVEYYAT